MTVISSSFDQPGAAFVFLPAGVKFPPIGKKWEKIGHSLQEATAHKGNVGVVAGNGYIGLDQDLPEAFVGLELPDTTTWETRPGRLGMWFKCNDRTPELLAKYGKKADQAQLKLFKDGKPVGEVKLERTYQVIPPSWKTLDDGPNAGQRADYKLFQEIPPAEISLAWLLSELQAIGITFSSKLDSKAAKLECIGQKARQKRAETDEQKTRRYAEAALKDEVQTLANAPEGNRNEQLNKSAFALGQFVGASALPESEVIRELSKAASYVGLTQNEIEKTISSGLEAGARHPRAVPGPTAKPDPDPDAVQDDDTRRIAKSILKHFDPLHFMLYVFNGSHKGDTTKAEIQFTAFGIQSAMNTSGVFGTWEGPSGKGKSDAAKACVRQLPERYVINSSVTAKSLYHRNESESKENGIGILPGTVLFLDDKNVVAGSDLEETLKKMQTFFQTGAEHETIDGKGKYHKTRLPPRMLVVRTYVDSQETDDQLKNRTDSFDVDSSKAVDVEVSELLLTLAERGETTETMNEGILICREMWNEIKSHTFKVITPDASRIVKFSDVSNRRNTQLFLDYVRGLACIRHMQRKKDDETILYASIDDYREAARLFNSQGEYLGSRLDKNEFAAIEYIQKQGASGATIAMIFDHLNKTFPNDGWNTQKVKRLMDGRKDRGVKGLADKVPGIETENFFDSSSNRRAKSYSIEGGITGKVKVTIDESGTK